MFENIKIKNKEIQKIVKKFIRINLKLLLYNFNYLSLKYDSEHKQAILDILLDSKGLSVIFDLDKVSIYKKKFNKNKTFVSIITLKDLKLFKDHYEWLINEEEK